MLILASSSPRRKELLKKLVKEFSICPPDIDESSLPLDAKDLPGELSKEKAYAVFAAADEEQRERYRRIEHVRWMRFLYMNNWRWAEKRDNAARLHPLLLPYEQLSRENQVKDDFSWELLGSLSKN